MPRPGTEVLIVDGAAPGAARFDTGTAYMVGTAEKGPTDRAVPIASVRKYEQTFGERDGFTLLYDGVSAFFGEGGGSLYVSRVAADDATAATGVLGTVFDASASSPGAWGNAVEVSLADAASPATGQVVVVKDDGAEVERSGVVADADAAVAWSQGSRYARLAKTAAGPWALPASGTKVTLSTGADGAAPGASDLSAALDRFDYAYGPGQVLAPGLTSAHAALLDHADRFRRCALLDAPDDDDPVGLGQVASALYGVAGARFASLWAPWAIYPGPVVGTTIEVPYSGVEAGIIARVDRAGNPNAPAAGADGVSRMALGLTQAFTDTDREALNEMGVDMAKLVYGDVRSYGYRTVAGPDDPNWRWFGNARVVMAIAHEADAAAETYVLKQIDGRGQLLARLNKDLRGICQRYYDRGALYGATPADAYDVDTGSGVNDIESIANGEIHAVVRVKCSPSAEYVEIEIVKVPIAQALAA
jgi:hypothetical protein